MTETAQRLAVGWCHGCGTLQLRDEMPMAWMPWSEKVEPACVSGDGEPWGMGVWDKGEHDAACPTVAIARAREVDWTPVFDECTCGGADDSLDDED
ncbi:hypothetical protein KIN34_14365 [Cellulomonas sp. DKR-3]|uniref:Uncharacterized protein n=1 Tax=Cellulomonas fulva TaxID=2835530 RepID=A0ABS5U255_9CELL|nr:hypothetical protein [Cellulomonas fulva]MBT0995467.1 hypothetical protein [Cellulomonas fulva]